MLPAHTEHSHADLQEITMNVLLSDRRGQSKASVTHLIHLEDFAREQGSFYLRALLRALTLSFKLFDKRDTKCFQRHELP